MTTGSARATRPTTVGATAKPLKRKHSRWFRPLIVVGVLVAASLAMTALTSGGPANTDALDPDNAGFTGARGLARVLRDHGVNVTVARSERELLDQAVDGATTVVITRTDHLSARTARRALAHAGSAASLVLLDPDLEVTKGMGLPVEPDLTDLSEVSADCTTALVGEDFQLSEARRSYTLTTSSSGGTGNSSAGSGDDSEATTCFPDKADGGGAMVVLPAAELGRPTVILLGDAGLISNGAILDADNAAIALHLLGQTDRLLWYIPALTDMAPADGTSRSIAPEWFTPGVVLTGSAVLLLCLWRGRRLGRLVVEPLPVVVRAVETTESRGRMYRKSRDRTRALAVLQLATRKRLAAYLGLSPSSAVTSVAAAAAAVSGRAYQDVLALLSSPAAQSDSSLLELANTLNALEKEVRRT